jgi:hypothetical protein
MTVDTDLCVTAHVGRVLLHDSAQFGHERLVVLEYLANAYQYRDRGVTAFVRITIDQHKKRIVIADNGSGMTREGLRHFFTMHGENKERLAGRKGRGRFGTGKSAAFGIAGLLRVTTVRNGLRNKAELTRDAVLHMSSGDAIPVATLERNRPTTEPNGTVIEIENIYLDRIDVRSIEQYIEAHIAEWPDLKVTINGRPICYTEPALACAPRIFTPKDPAIRALIGNAKLTVKVAKSVVPEHIRGIAIRANGVLHETTLDAAAGKEMSQFIFGDIDVPQLDDETAGISAFDVSRNMRLNRRNPVVAALLRFINPHVEAVRRELVEAERKRRQVEDLRHLNEKAAAISQIINRDWMANNVPIGGLKLRMTGQGKRGVKVDENGYLTVVVENPAEFVEPATDEPVEERVDETTSTEEEPRDDTAPDPKDQEPDFNDLRGDVPEDEATEDEATGDEDPKDNRPKDRQQNLRKSNKGGFNVEFRNLGEAEEPAIYQRDARMIYINLDHPKLMAAASSPYGTEDEGFMRVAYDAAFVAYAVAFAEEREQRRFYTSPSEAVADIRETIDRVSRCAAEIYKPNA